ncbi:hypothetical protein NDU88_007324 [Pleurodeles waltl]|uniref:Uncharacterized protein n=1 Tax=Pleurodeles waltl TaxID=8319 RepID=A0AAV7RUQ6_PLEWA|nr:hypothetical protein NDU88_007324 [Pleurodeles waltl]
MPEVCSGLSPAVGPRWARQVLQRGVDLGTALDAVPENDAHHSYAQRGAEEYGGASRCPEAPLVRSRHVIGLASPGPDEWRVGAQVRTLGSWRMGVVAKDPKEEEVAGPGQIGSALISIRWYQACRGKIDLQGLISREFGFYYMLYGSTLGGRLPGA